MVRSDPHRHPCMSLSPRAAVTRAFTWQDDQGKVLLLHLAGSKSLHNCFPRFRFSSLAPGWVPGEEAGVSLTEDPLQLQPTWAARAGPAPAPLPATAPASSPSRSVRVTTGPGRRLAPSPRIRPLFHRVEDVRSQRPFGKAEGTGDLGLPPPTAPAKPQQSARTPPREADESASKLTATCCDTVQAASLNEVCESVCRGGGAAGRVHRCDWSITKGLFSCFFRIVYHFRIFRGNT